MFGESEEILADKRDGPRRSFYSLRRAACKVQNAACVTKLNVKISNDYR